MSIYPILRSERLNLMEVFLSVL
uniref:Uncharacterized protein n=1 Tax=Arundo donax TaxID=35708 RepID=A0A0A9BGC2_ARUDO